VRTASNPNARPTGSRVHPCVLLRRPKRNIKNAMAQEIMLYGIAQKEQLGFDKAVEECKYRMSRYGVTPNMLIMPPQVCPAPLQPGSARARG